MGKASSSKKVARAARAAGRPGSGRNYGWPILIGSIVIAGALLIVFSRGGNEEIVQPALGDHWHAAYGIYDCGTFLPNLTDEIQDISGLHTHADGLMHMHPFGTRYTGEGANIGNWGETVGLELSDTSYRADSVERENGDPCGESGDGVLQLKVWDDVNDEEGRLIESDFADYAPQDLSLWVLAFVPEGTEIPKPPQENLDSLRAPVDVTGATTTTPVTVEPDGSSTTAPGTETTTTAPGTETTTSTAPPETTVPTSTP